MKNAIDIIRTGQKTLANGAVQTAIMVLFAALLSGHAWTLDDPVQRAPFLQSRGSKLYFGDREYRAIGVNMPFVSRVFTGQMNGVAMPDAVPHAQSVAIENITLAASNGLAFVRLFAYPNTPAEIAWYDKNKELYWSRMDEFMALCRKMDLKVIPSLGVFPPRYQEMTGEPLRAIVDANSKTYKVMYAFVGEMVGRYKDDANILMWEISNELLHKADVAGPGKMGDTDRLTFDQIVQHYRQVTTFIKSVDRNHLVTSGDGDCRTESMFRRMGWPVRKESMDSLRDHLSNLIGGQPEPLDVFSIHMYGPDLHVPNAHPSRVDPDGYRLFPGGLRATEYNVRLVRGGRLTGMPVLVGELGQAFPYYNQDATAAWTRDMIDRLEAEDVSLIGLWVWRFPEQPQFTFDETSQPQLVQRAVAFNRKYGTLPTTYTSR